MNQLTFEELFKRFYPEYHNWESARIDDEYDQETPKDFWESYSELMDDYETTDDETEEMYRCLSRLREFIRDRLENWFADEIDDLTGQYYSKYGDSEKDYAEIVLQYLAKAYCRYEQIIKEVKKDSIKGNVPILLNRFYQSIISDTFFRINKGDFQVSIINEYASKDDDIFEKWVLKNKLKEDIERPWTGLMLFLFIANRIDRDNKLEEKFAMHNIRYYIIQATALSFQNIGICPGMGEW